MGFCARSHKTLHFPWRYDTEEDLVDRIVTTDETWVEYVSAESKQQSMAWGHSSFPKKPKKNTSNLWPSCFRMLRESCLSHSWNVVPRSLLKFTVRKNHPSHPEQTWRCDIAWQCSPSRWSTNTRPFEPVQIERLWSFPMQPGLVLCKRNLQIGKHCDKFVKLLMLKNNGKLQF